MKPSFVIPMIVTFFLMLSENKSVAQSKIKDGSVSGTSSLPNSNAILELESSNRGFLLPRLELSNTTSFAPLSAHLAGIAVYNTASAGDVSPGYYYNDGTKWVRLADASAADTSKDAWVDDPVNTMVKLGSKSNGTLRPTDSAFVIKDNGRTGIGLADPAGILDIKGKMYVNNRQTVYNAGALDTSFTGSYFLGDGGQNLSYTSGNDARYNIGIGLGVLHTNTTGNRNIAAGYQAMYSNIIGSYNIANGYQALYSNTEGTGNIGNGYQALYSNTTGSDNIGNGYQALFSNIGGSENIANGNRSMYSNTGGTGNIASGKESLYFNTEGSENVANGKRTLYSNTTGSYNVAVGSSVLSDQLSGTGNTAIGYGTGGGITTGARNTILGANVTGLPPGLSNNIILADGQGNQRIRVLANGYTGIGTVSPASTLQVAGSMAAIYTYTTTALTLDSSHHFVTAGDAVVFTLPAASSCQGRSYHIRIETSGTTISGPDGGYKNLSGVTTTATTAGTGLHIVSTGTRWLEF